MAIKNGKYIVEYILNIENISPINIGGDDKNPLIDSEGNNVYIPGTTVAGAFKAFLNRKSNNNDKVFGENDELSKVFIYDSYAPLKSYEVRPAVNIDGFSGANKPKGKFERTLVGTNHEFKIKIEIYGHSLGEIEEYKRSIEECIVALDCGDIMLGSYKSSGAGLFKVKEIRTRSFNLNNKSELFKFLLEDEYSDASYNKVDIMNVTKNLGQSSNIVTFNLKGTIKTPLLIEGYSSLDENRADGEQMINSHGQCVIPGSSLKGVIRAEASRILTYFDKMSLFERIFGSEGDTTGEEKLSSKITVLDTIIKYEKYATYNRIKVDRFTGGVRKSALAQDEPVIGDVNLIAKYRMVSHEAIDNNSIALLALIFRDISIGELPIGGGNNVGRGRLEGELLTISKGNEVLFKGNINKNAIQVDKLKDYIKFFNEGKGER